MTPDTITSFLTYYLRSLRERTRDETKGAQYGLDWVAVAKYAHRQPYERTPHAPRPRHYRDPLLDLSESVLAVLPITPEHKETWECLEYVLTDTLRRDRALFKRRLTQLAGRLMRKTLCLSKCAENHLNAIDFIVSGYNLAIKQSTPD